METSWRGSREIDAGVVLTGGVDDRMVRLSKMPGAGYKRVKLKIDENTNPLELKKLVDSS